MTYDAFISYSHAVDAELAPMLQSALERYATPWYRRRALRVFRDETGLSANPGLWSSIATVLDESEWLILLASPESAASTWVDRELAHWIGHRGSDHILPLVTHGRWDWNDPTSTSIPARLRAAFDEEPRHVDMRWAATDPEGARRSPRFRAQLADVAAPLHGVAKDELEGADIRQHRRTLRLARAAVAVLACLTLIAVIATVFALNNASRARRARDDADFRNVLAQSTQLETSNPQLAMLLAVEARHASDTNQSRAAIQDVLVHNRQFLGTVTDVDSRDAIVSICPLADGRRLAITDDAGSIRVVDIATGRGISRPRRLVPLSRTDIPAAGATASTLGCAAPTRGNRLGVASAGGTVGIFDPRAHKLVARRHLAQPLNDLAISPDGATVAVGAANGTVLIWSADNLRAAPHRLASGEAPTAVAFSPDGQSLATTTTDRILLWDTATWQLQGAVDDPPSINQTGGLTSLPEPGRKIAFCPSGPFLVDARRATTQMVDLERATISWSIASDYVDAAAFAFAPGGCDLFAPDRGDVTRRYDSASGSVLSSPGPEGIRWLATSTDGATLLAVNRGGGLAVDRWSLDGRGAISRTIGTADQQLAPGSRLLDGTVLTQPVGSSIVVSAIAWDLRTGKKVRNVPTAAFPQLFDDHTVAGFFVDQLVITRYDLRTGQYYGPRYPVDVSGVTNTGNDIAGNIVLAYNDGTIRRYRPDGRQVGNPWLKLTRPPYSVDVSSQGLVALNFLDGSAAVYRLDTGKLAYPPVGGFAEFGFSPDGRLMAGANRHGNVIIVRATTGRRISPPLLDVLPNTFSTVFGPHHQVALNSGTTARVYDLRSGQPTSAKLPDDNAGRVTFNTAGNELASSTSSGVTLWDLDTEHWEQASCTLAGRNLTHDEWTTYFPNSGTYHRTCSRWPEPARS